MIDKKMDLNLETWLSMGLFYGHMLLIIYYQL